MKIKVVLALIFPGIALRFLLLRTVLQGQGDLTFRKSHRLLECKVGPISLKGNNHVFNLILRPSTIRFTFGFILVNGEYRGVFERTKYKKE